jgi:tRNA (cmo5U34)-methyltransferase
MESKTCLNCVHWTFTHRGSGDCDLIKMPTNSQYSCEHFENGKLAIPKEWTFKGDAIANNFDSHVREQLPFYDIATQAIIHIARNYVPTNGMVYDVGASTGNITIAMLKSLEDRKPTIYAIDDSPSMREVFAERVKDLNADYFYITSDALKYEFKTYDFAVCFLTFMFFPIGERRTWLAKMRSLIKPGGALVVVDKIVTPSGYVGTVLRRLAMDWKLKGGAKAEDIIAKELSLAGYQRPVDERMFESFGSHKFFQLGEFAGWIIERGE